MMKAIHKTTGEEIARIDYDECFSADLEHYFGSELSLKGCRYWGEHYPDAPRTRPADLPTEYKAYPIYAYVHGQVAFSTSQYSCPFDSSPYPVGRIWASDKEAAEARLSALADVTNGYVYCVLADDDAVGGVLAPDLALFVHELTDTPVDLIEIVDD